MPNFFCFSFFDIRVSISKSEKRENQTNLLLLFDQNSLCKIESILYAPLTDLRQENLIRNENFFLEDLRSVAPRL